MCGNLGRCLTQVVGIVERADTVAQGLTLAAGVVDEGSATYLAADTFPDVGSVVETVHHVAMDVGLVIGAPCQLYRTLAWSSGQTCRRFGKGGVDLAVGGDKLPQHVVACAAGVLHHVASVRGVACGDTYE